MQRDTHSDLLGLGTSLLALPMLSGMLEAPILAWTDRVKAQRQFVVAAGLAGMALSVAMTSWAHSTLGLALAAAAYGPASGIALGTAEAMLVDGAGDDAPRRLARWTLFASLGDVLAPALLLLTHALGVSWRASFRGAAVALCVVALAATRMPAGEHGDDDDDEAYEPVFDALRAALSNRLLLGWLLGATLCTLLDELLAMFAGLWVSSRFSPALLAPTLIAFSAGATAGSALLERLLAHRAPKPILAASSALCALAYLAWLLAPSAGVSVALFVLVGATAASLHPLAKAEAFAALPSRPGVVNGAAQAFLAIDLLAPVVMAAVGARFGLRAALALLVTQPLALLALALLAMRRDATPSEPL